LAALSYRKALRKEEAHIERRDTERTGVTQTRRS